MSRPIVTHLHLARVTLEALTPLSIGAGGADGVHDMGLCRDFDGLPCITGATIQGVLRSLWPAADRPAIFGFQRGANGRAGRLMVSDAAVHGADNRSRIVGSPIPADDAILGQLREDAPLRRDHVRIHQRGVVDGDGKFERLAAPAGTRFSFEMAIFGTAAERAVLEKAIDALASPDLWLGGGSGRGYGRIKVKAASVWTGDLRSTAPGAVGQARQLPFSAAVPGFRPYNPQPSASSGSAARIVLQPIEAWRVGKGDSEASRSGREKTPHATPLREVRIEWRDGRGQLHKSARTGLTVPGSSLKGVIAHRALFHYRRFAGAWADCEPDAVFDGALDRPEGLVELFGDLRRGRGGEPSDGQAARLVVEDAEVVEGRCVVFDHNSIDRFTGGVRNRVLFSEEAVRGGEIAITLRLRPPRAGSKPPDEMERARALKALRAAIEDLCLGRLAIGAKSLGFCTAKPGWEAQLDKLAPVEAVP